MKRRSSAQKMLLNGWRITATYEGSCWLAQGERKQRFLLQFVGLGRAGCRGGVGGALDAAQLGAQDPLQPRRHKRERTHIGRFFLHPDELARVLVPAQNSTNVFFRERIHLLERNDGWH